MEFCKLFGFIKILHESFKLLPKNGKLMAFITIILLVLTSSLFLLLTFPLQSLVHDMSKSSVHLSNTNQSASPHDHMKEDLALIITLEIAFILAIFIIYFFSSIAIILVSAMSYGGNTSFTLKDLISRIVNTWKSPLITTLYASGLMLGYFVFVFLLLSPLLIYSNFTTTSFAIFIGTASLILYLYLVVVWTLSIVISILEESNDGVKAIGKAKDLAKGKMLDGFMLNLFFILLTLIIDFCCIMLIRNNKRTPYALIYDLLVVNICSLINIFTWVAYSVLYFQCKKLHGEDIEIHGIEEYTSLLANEMP